MQDKLIQAVEKMPAFPKSVHKVILMTSDINCSQKDLVEVIKNDPVFTLKILKMVNSPFFGLVKEVTSINQASVYLGLNTLKNVALGLAAIGTLPRKNEAGFDMNAFWLHSLAVATIARMLGEAMDVSREEAGDYFAAGLLHDVGKAVLALHLSEQYKDALTRALEGERPLYVFESEIFGEHHGHVGGLLAGKWNLPKRLVLAIGEHHAEPDDLMGACVAAANQVAKRKGYGFAGSTVVEPLPGQVQARLGHDLEGLVELLEGVDQEVDKARAFIQFGEA